MVYTEIRTINGRKYYYRVNSVRRGKRVVKKRLYLGSGLSGLELLEKEKEADKRLIPEKIRRTNKEIEKIKKKITGILKKNKVTKAGIFGSYARGEHGKKSDIDILIEHTKNMSLLDLSGLKLALEEVLNKEVEIISYKYIHPYLKNKILKSEVRII